MNELARRVVVALVGAPIALGLIWIGDAALTTLLGVMAAIGAWEFYRLARDSGAAPMAPLGIVLSALIPIAVHAHYLGVARMPIALVPLVAVATLGASIWLRGVEGQPLASTSSTIFGAIYTGGTLSFAYALRYHNYAVGDMAGALVVIFPLVLTWASDIGAYFSGRAIGGRKLMPSVSPGKTIAGAIGAVITTIVVAYALVHLLLIPHAQLAFTPVGLVIFAVLVSVTAQIGDLAESLLKREAGVKDSGTLFPGHGGVLDRLDSLFFVLPTAYVLYDLLLIPAPGGR